MSYFRADIRGDVSDIIKDIDDIPDKVIRPSANKAINVTLVAVRQRGGREIAAELNIPQGHVLKRLKLHKSKVRTLSGRVVALTEPLRVGDIGKPRQTKKGARAARRVFPHSFVATMPSGKTSVFHRKGKARLPIKYTVLELHKSASTKIDSLMRGNFRETTFREAFLKEARRRMQRLKK